MLFFFVISAYYIDKCYKDDPQVNDCLLRSMNKLAEHFRHGIPELGITEVLIFFINH